MNGVQLAQAAELRIWRLILNADEQVQGLDPSRVRGHAVTRAEWLDTQLIGVSVAEQDDALASASEPDVNRAFGEAALAMRSTLDMINSESEMAQ